MKKFHLSGLSLFLLALTVLCLHPSNLSAAAPAAPPQAQPPRAGSKVGGFFKGLFYGRSSSGRYMGEETHPQAGSSGYSLDRPPQERSASPQMAPVDPITPAPLTPQELPQESNSLPQETLKSPATEPKITATKPAPKKADTPPVTLKPTADEALPSEAPKTSPNTNPIPKTESRVAANTPAPDPVKPAPEPKVEAPAPAPSSGGLPVGSRTDKPGRVKSPYPPYNELDVSGLQSGSLAMDPTTQKVFRLP